MSGVRPALEAEGGGTWLGWSGSTVRPGRRRSVRVASRGTIRAVGLELTATEVERYYNCFCNEALWPLLHSFTCRFSVEASDFACYRAVNRRFAREVARHLEPDDRVWVHDFHLMPLGAELRRLGFGGRLGFFLHVPFPSHDAFSLLPWAGELLADLDRYDLVGFHVRSYAANYLEAVRRELPSRADAQCVGVYPLGIAPAVYADWADERRAVRRGQELRRAVQGRRLILGVDRLDYTKGIPERLRIYGRLLEKYPRWRKRVAFVQISAPSRTRVPEYVRQRREVEELVGNINGRFGHPDWVPVRYLFRSYEQRELAALYREADVCLVSPLRDGMNLVAKEFVAAQTGDPGVLVLSRFTGAAEEMAEAVLINPYDLDGSARALHEALSMPLAERTRRQRALLTTIESNTAAKWGHEFLHDLDVARRPEPLAHVRAAFARRVPQGGGA